MKEKIKYRINRAETTLLEADAMLNMGFLSAALNRYYYACFYATTALLLTKELNPKTHSGVRTLFTLHFIQKGIVPIESGQFFTQLFDKRQRNDYDDYIDVDKETVNNFSVLAKQFVSILKKIIEP